MRIYIAGPYSSDPEGNTKEAIRIGNMVRDMGHTPFIPHLTYMWDKQHPRDYEDWMAWDFEWLAQCQLVIRMPGHSPGADRELAEASRLGIDICTFNFFMRHCSQPLEGATP